MCSCLVVCAIAVNEIGMYWCLNCHVQAESVKSFELEGFQFSAVAMVCNILMYVHFLVYFILCNAFL